MDEAHMKAQSTRERNLERKAEAEARSAESTAAILESLRQVSTDPAATIEHKLEAARLAVELNKKY